MAPGWRHVWPTRGGGHLPAVTPPTANSRASLEPTFGCPPNISTHFGRSWTLMDKMDLLDDRAELTVGAAVSGTGPRTVNGLRDDSTVEERGDKMSGSGTQHHFLRHCLPTDSQGLATLAHFGVSTIAEATRAVKRMSQRELQHTFRAVRDGPAFGFHAVAAFGAARAHPRPQHPSCRFTEPRHSAITTNGCDGSFWRVSRAGGCFGSARQGFIPGAKGWASSPPGTGRSAQSRTASKETRSGIRCHVGGIVGLFIV